MPRTKKNATFLAWLQEMRDEEDSDSNKYMILNKAFKSLKQETKEYSDPDSLIAVKFIGPKIVSDLKKRWKTVGGVSATDEISSNSPSPSKRKRSSGAASASEPRARGRPRKQPLFAPETDDEDALPEPKRRTASMPNREGSNRLQADGPPAFLPPQYPLGVRESHHPHAENPQSHHIPVAPVASHGSYAYQQAPNLLYSNPALPALQVAQSQQFEFSYIDDEENQVLDCHRALIEIKDGVMWYKIGFLNIPSIVHPLKQRVRPYVNQQRGKLVWAWVSDQDVEHFGVRSAPGISVLDASSVANKISQHSQLSTQTAYHSQGYDAPTESVRSQSATEHQRDSLGDLLKAESKRKRNTIDPARVLGIEREWDVHRVGMPPGSGTGVVKKDEKQLREEFPSQASMRVRAAIAATARRQSAESFLASSSGTHPPSGSSANPALRRSTTLPNYSTESNANTYSPRVLNSTATAQYAAPPAPEGLLRTATAPAVPLPAGPIPKANLKGKRRGRVSEYAPGLCAVDEFDMDLDRQAASQRAHTERVASTSTSTSHTAADLIDDVTDLISANAPPLEDFDPIIFTPGSFDIHLVLDNREVKSHKDRDYIAKELRSKGVNVTQRSLPLGDVLWIARMGDSECVLDYILERKRLDDLCSSIKDGRFREQKFRLANTGLRVFYLIEAFDLEKNQENFGVQLDTARSSTQMVDGFIVKETKKLSYTIDYLVAMHRTITEQYQNGPLYIIPPHAIKRHSYMALQKTLRTNQPNISYLTSYICFEGLNSKSGNMTTRDLFALMLLCVKGVSSEKASAIIGKYPTFRNLWDAFRLAELKEREVKELEAKEAAISSEQGKKGKGQKKSKVPQAKEMLYDPQANGRQQIGRALSAKIYRIVRENLYEG